MAKKYKYVYDLKSKKLIKKHILNEDENTGNVTTDNVQQQNQQEQQNQQQATPQSQSLLDNKDLQSIQVQLNNREKKYQEDLQAQQKLLQVAQVNATKKGYSGPYDPAQVDIDVLNIQKKINDLNKQYAIDKANLEDKRINVLKQLGTTNERWYNLPEKYKGLNESNIDNVKVYLNNIFSRQTSIDDFKNIFENTSLLYGKDRYGYFTVVIDDEDIGMITEALTAVGYTKDQVLYTIMPQVFEKRANNL